MARPLRKPSTRRPGGGAPPWPDSLLAVREETLPNGLQVRVLADPTLPIASYTTVFRTGSRNERPGKTGIAHLFEHMMFNGTERYGPGEFDRVIESFGGHSNAWTSNDLTVYHEEVPSAAVPKMIELEADRMRSLRVTPPILERERKVVQEERLLRVDNDLEGLVDEELGALVFQSHPYRWPVVGWGPDLEALTPEDCAAFFRAHYAPGRATVWVVGDVAAEETLALVRGAYGDIPAGPEPPPVSIVEPPQRGERRSRVERPAEAPLLAVAWPAPAARDEGIFTLDLVQAVLGQGEFARLVRSLVRDKALAVSVDVTMEWRIDPGLFAVFLTLVPGTDPERVEEVLAREIEDLARSLGEGEVARARRLLESDFLRAMATVGGRAGLLGTIEALRGSWGDVRRWGERYEAVTAAQVRRAARDVFRDDRRSVVTLVPKGGA